MLVLSRQKDESVIIAAGTPYETRVTVVEFRGDKVRLGFEAHPDVTIHRQEVQEAIDAQRQHRDGRENR